MKYLITGVAGHLGSRLANHIRHEKPGAVVVGVDDYSCGYDGNLPSGIYFQKMDAACDEMMLHDFDVVYHFAAYAAECMSPFCRRYNYRNNLVTTAGLISNLINQDFKGRLVFASSIAVYGDIEAPFDEIDSCRPKDPYGVAKLACEQDIKIAGDQHGLNWCIVRPHNIFGPHQSIWQKYRNVIGLWMRAVLEDQPITIFGDGDQQRAFTYVDDILRPLIVAGINPRANRKVINLGGSKPMSLNDLFDVFCAAIGRDVELRREPPRHEVKIAHCTTKRSEEYLEYRDVTPMLDGIKRMWEWAQKAWEWYPERRSMPARPLIEDIETTKKMPPKWATVH